MQGAQIGAGGGTESHGPLTLTTDYHYAEKYVQLEVDRTVAVCITRRKLDPICELRNTLALLGHSYFRNIFCFCSPILTIATVKKIV